jgi:septal ring factor EnvC (AmiA/AmiB activator)
MRNQMMKKEEEVEKLEEEVVMLRVKVVKLNKNIEEASTSSVNIVEEKFTGHRKGKVKRSLRVMQKSSKVL